MIINIIWFLWYMVSLLFLLLSCVLLTGPGRQGFKETREQRKKLLIEQGKSPLLSSVIHGTINLSLIFAPVIYEVYHYIKYNELTSMGKWLFLIGG